MSKQNIERFAVFFAGVLIGWVMKPTPAPQAPEPDNRDRTCNKKPEYTRTDARSPYSNTLIDIRTMAKEQADEAAAIAHMAPINYRLSIKEQTA